MLNLRNTIIAATAIVPLAFTTIAAKAADNDDTAVGAS